MQEIFRYTPLIATGADTFETVTLLERALGYVLRRIWTLMMAKPASRPSGQGVTQVLSELILIENNGAVPQTEIEHGALDRDSFGLDQTRSRKQAAGTAQLAVNGNKMVRSANFRRPIDSFRAVL